MQWNNNRFDQKIVGSAKDKFPKFGSAGDLLFFQMQVRKLRKLR
jgi:hypothetical protein